MGSLWPSAQKVGNLRVNVFKFRVMKRKLFVFISKLYKETFIHKVMNSETSMSPNVVQLMLD